MVDVSVCGGMQGGPVPIVLRIKPLRHALRMSICGSRVPQLVRAPKTFRTAPDTDQDCPSQACPAACAKHGKPQRCMDAEPPHSMQASLTFCRHMRGLQGNGGIASSHALPINVLYGEPEQGRSVFNACWQSQAARRACSCRIDKVAASEALQQCNFLVLPLW